MQQLFDRDGKSSIGCVLRNDQGQFMAGYGGSSVVVVNPKHADALTFKEALSWLKKMRISYVHIQLDSCPLFSRLILKTWTLYIRGGLSFYC